MASTPSIVRTSATFTEELQDIVRLLHDAPRKSANEIYLLEMARRLLHLKHGASWDDTPVLTVEPR